MNNEQLIVTMYKNNIGIDKIATILQIPRLDVFNCLKQNSLERPEYKFIERDEQVCEQYKKGIKITDIAKNLGIDRHTVSGILNVHFTDRINRNASNWSAEKKERNDKIISLYQEGNSISQVAKLINIHPSTIAKVLRDLRVPRRPQHQKGHSRNTTKNRKHKFNLDFFQQIDTEEKAYWLGFLYADGNVCERGTVTLALQERDLKHVENFRTAIGSDDIPISYNKKTKSYSLIACSIKMVRDLMELGCVPRKSLILKFPDEQQVPDTLIHHFMRGYFDGDGCITLTNKKTPEFSVLGTPEFLDRYEKILLNHITNNKPTKRIHQDSWNKQTEAIFYGGHRVVEIYEFLYKDANIFLKRKKEKFDNIYSCHKAKQR